MPGASRYNSLEETKIGGQKEDYKTTYKRGSFFKTVNFS
jgi:hypothetical protein